MSNVSTTHNVTSHITGQTKPLFGQRLSVVAYKTDKKTGVKPESKSVSIPKFEIAPLMVRVTEIQDSILELAYKAQDAIVRELVEFGKSFVQDTEIGIDAIIAYLNDSSESGRLTRKVLDNWFDMNVSEMLQVALADKLGLSNTPTLQESNKVDLLVASYKDKLAALSGGNTSYSPKVATQLLRALEVASVEDSIASKLVAKLTKMRDVTDSLEDVL